MKLQYLGIGLGIVVAGLLFLIREDTFGYVGGLVFIFIGSIVVWLGITDE